MSHPNVKFLDLEKGTAEAEKYYTYKGPGWYFFDPEDDERLNIQGVYETEERALEAYYNYCEALTV